MIRQGELLLAGAQALPSATLSSLHFMIGDAYTTIVWLATTAHQYHNRKIRPMAAGEAGSAGACRAAFRLEHGPTGHRRRGTLGVGRRLPRQAEIFLRVTDAIEARYNQ
jgi:hypothetical protein